MRRNPKVGTFPTRGWFTKSTCNAGPCGGSPCQQRECRSGGRAIFRRRSAPQSGLRCRSHGRLCHSGRAWQPGLDHVRHDSLNHLPVLVRGEEPGTNAVGPLRFSSANFPYSHRNSFIPFRHSFAFSWPNEYEQSRHTSHVCQTSALDGYTGSPKLTQHAVPLRDHGFVSGNVGPHDRHVGIQNAGCLRSHNIESLRQVVMSIRAAT